MSESLSIENIVTRKFDFWGFFGRFFSASATLAGVGALAAFSVLFTYLHAIGSPELIGRALTSPSALWPWILISSLLLLFYVVVLLITTAAYASALNVFKETPDVQPAMAGYLFVPAFAGVVAAVCSTMLNRNLSVSGMFIDSAVWVAVGMIVLFLTSNLSASLRKAILAEKADVPSKLQYAKHIFALVGGAWVAALTATIPMLGVLSTTSLLADPGGMKKLVLISIFITALGFVPAIAFYVSKGRRLIRARNALVGVLILIIGTLIVIPSIVPATVDRAASLAGIKDVRVFHYMLKETYATEDFDGRWGRVVETRNHPVVEGFVLFTLGDVTLLCPKALKDTSLSEWASESGACLTMSSKMVIRMPMKP